jgi:hypothetical protein
MYTATVPTQVFSQEQACVTLGERSCRENSDKLRELFCQKQSQMTLEARRRQVEDNTMRRINALQEKTAWDECEAFEGLKATMQGWLSISRTLGCVKALASYASWTSTMSI